MKRDLIGLYRLCTFGTEGGGWSGCLGVEFSL